MVLGCLNMVEIREDRTSSWSVWNWWYWLVGIVGWPCRIGILLALGRQTTGIQRRWVNGLCCNWFPLYIIPAIRGCFFVQLLCISWVINRGTNIYFPFPVDLSPHAQRGHPTTLLDDQEVQLGQIRYGDDSQLWRRKELCSHPPNEGDNGTLLLP